MEKYKSVMSSFKQKDFENKCLCCGNNKNLTVHKGNGEKIIGCDFISYSCPNCKKTYYFCDVKYVKYKDI